MPKQRLNLLSHQVDEAIELIAFISGYNLVFVLIVVTYPFFQCSDDTFRLFFTGNIEF